MADKPVKLQVNTSGAWKDVAFFDVNDQGTADQVMEGAAQIGVAANVHFRIATRDSFQTVLMHCKPGQGWKAAAR